MTRRRFALMLAFLGLAIVVAVAVTAQDIERRLLADAQGAIAAAGIPYYDLRLEGRDAVLGGFVAEGTDVATLRTLVAEVPGIRVVRDETVVEREPRSAMANPATPVSVAVAAELRVQRLGSTLIVSGRLPDDGTREDILEALRGEFPRARVESRLQANPAVASAPWNALGAELAAALGEVDSPARLVAFGSVVQLNGSVRTSAQRSRIDDLASTHAGVDWRLVLTRPGGGIGGGT